MFMFDTSHDRFLRLSALLIDTQSGASFSFEIAL